MQKLSFRDSIILSVVLSIAIIIVGIMFLIKPKMADISSTQAALESAQAEWDDLEKKISQIDTIKGRIQTKYQESRTLGEFFVDINRSNDLERFMQEYINRNRIYIMSGASFSNPSLVTLSPYTLNKQNLVYSIGESADLTGENNQEEESSSSVSGTDQTLPCGTVAIDYQTTRAELMQFFNDIKYSGKAIEVKSFSINSDTYSMDQSAVMKGNLTIEVYYAKMISDIDINAEIAAASGGAADTDVGTSTDSGTESSAAQ